jgi:5-hydroxyisourate hydrolase
MGSLSTHVLDSGTGKPAEDVQVTWEMKDADGWVPLASATTDADGRIRDWGSDVIVTPGIFRLTFGTGEWFGRQGRECFYPEVTVTFEVLDGSAHFHVPLLLSAFAYSTYRGS